MPKLKAGFKLIYTREMNDSKVNDSIERDSDWSSDVGREHEVVGIYTNVDTPYYKLEGGGSKGNIEICILDKFFNNNPITPTPMSNITELTPLQRKSFTESELKLYKAGMIGTDAQPTELGRSELETIAWIKEQKELLLVADVLNEAKQ